MPLVGPRMHGDAARPGLDREAGERAKSGTPVRRELRSSAILLRLTLRRVIGQRGAMPLGFMRIGSARIGVHAAIVGSVAGGRVSASSRTMTSQFAQDGAGAVTQGFM